MLAAHLVAQPSADLGEQPVALEVPERLVDLLEAVEVDQDQGELPLAARVSRELLGKPLVQRPVVADPGQLVAAGEREQAGLLAADPPRQRVGAGAEREQAERVDRQQQE
jgi:hypothetical protein